MKERYLLFVVLFLALGCGGRPASRPVQEKQTKGSVQTEKSSVAMRFFSPVFASGERIPMRYTGDGEDISPELVWDSVPEGTNSFALICSDPDAPLGTFIHWVVYDIPQDARRLPEGVPGIEELEDSTRQGVNSFQRIGYNGPKPPPGKPHRYFFRLYALDKVLDLKPGASAGTLHGAMVGHILGEAELMGTYGR